MTRDVQAAIVAREMPSARSLLLACRPLAAFATAEPGQFVHVDTGPERTLRRPFSVAGVTPAGELELLIELRGEGTRALADLAVGSQLTMMGPLGRGFTLAAPHGTEDAPRAGEDALHAAVVAGGIGVAGVRFLAQRLFEEGADATLFVGARTADALLHSTLPEPTEVRVATDDGTAGVRGTVCDLFAAESVNLPPNTRVYGCGPRAMLDSLAAVADERGMTCELSLEEMMACGVGACRGCVVSTIDGYRTVCKDGPVFNASLLIPEGRLMEVAGG